MKPLAANSLDGGELGTHDVASRRTLVLFSRYPEAGRTKTRLARLLGPGRRGEGPAGDDGIRGSSNRALAGQVWGAV